MTIVYTKKNCVQCDATKRYLDMHAIAYETVDIETDADALEKIVALGFRAAPVVESSIGSWSGYDPDKLSKLK
jgi:glutaredoxin-like protein NrdH